MEQFTFVKRGYDPEEVDKYITTLEQVIKSYKDKDNAIKNAIISAQRTAEDVVKNAQAEAVSYKAQMGEQLVGMRGALDSQRANLQNFQNASANVIRRCMQELEQFDMSAVFAGIDEMDAAIAALQGLETMSKDRLMPNQSMEPRSMQRDTMQDFNAVRAPEPRERDMGYQSRDMSREAAPAPMRETMRPHSPSPDPYGVLRDTRDTRSLDADRPVRDVLRDTGMDMMRTRPAPAAPAPQHEPMRDTREMMVPDQQYAPAPREAMYDPMRDTGRDMNMMRDDSRDMMRPPAPMREYAPVPEQPRELIRDTRPRSDFGRDIRRDYGRDMRSDSGRDVRRDEYPQSRPDGRELTREMPRQYAPDPDNYDDQNLLPPVASLM